MLLVSREVKHRAADHYIGKVIRKGHPLDDSNLEVACWKSGPKGGSQLPHMLHSFGILVERKHLGAFAQKVNKVSPVTTSGIENTHSTCDVPSQNLIEYIDVDLSKLFLNAEGHAFIIAAYG